MDIIVKEKKKYNYTKKTGRPLKTVANTLPENWKDIIYEMSAKGCSDVEIRAHFLMLDGKFSQKTWDAIKSREEEFFLTIQQAKVLCQAWWERVGREGIHAETFNTGCWYANMKNRFGWRDKADIDGTLNLNVSISDILKDDVDDKRKTSNRISYSTN